MNTVSFRFSNISGTKAEKKMDRALTTEVGEVGTRLPLPYGC